MDNGSLGPLKPRLRDLAGRGHAAQQTLVAELTPAERAAIGDPEHWSAKDHIAHLTAWIVESARLLTGAGEGGTPAPTPEETAFNAAVFAAQRARAWSAVLDDAAAAHAALLTAIDRCSEADLAAPDRFAWREGRPLSTLVLGNGYQHPIEHYVAFYTAAGRVARAEAVQQAAVATIAELFGRSEAYSFAVYNLGCFYAKQGQAVAALAAVEQALALNPGLREWAGQDADLASLHEDPAFAALLKE